VIPYIISSLALGFAGLFVYIYYLKKGQFEDQEEVKYQIFHDEEKEPK
jgi:cbb3-type cytochrome oxidase maturation protein